MLLEHWSRRSFEYVALAVFKGQGKPSDRWSLFNRFPMLLAGTTSPGDP